MFTLCLPVSSPQLKCPILESRGNAFWGWGGSGVTESLHVREQCALVCPHTALRFLFPQSLEWHWQQTKDLDNQVKANKNQENVYIIQGATKKFHERSESSNGLRWSSPIETLWSILLCSLSMAGYTHHSSPWEVGGGLCLWDLPGIPSHFKASLSYIKRLHLKLPKN